MRFNSINEIKWFNLVSKKVTTVMTESERYIPFKFVRNGFN
jgi:hypothetical protein